MRAHLAIVILLVCAPSTRAFGDTFGSGANAFDIEFVPIGNPGNAPDTTGNPNPAGSVPYTYNIGKFEVSRDMITKVNATMSVPIFLADMTEYGGNGVNRPATGLRWTSAARFVNWLNTSTGSSPAYKFIDGNFALWTPSDPGYNPNNLFRNSLARYFLPSSDEWYKAAYYDPISGDYYNYPTGSNSAPTAVASGTAPGTAVYRQALATGPADITLAGGLSPYGTMGQGGNVFEWEETEFDLVNDSTLSARGIRSTNWNFTNLGTSLDRRDVLPSGSSATLGFRVASAAVPEPSALLLITVASLAPLLHRRRISVPHNRV